MLPAILIAAVITSFLAGYVTRGILIRHRAIIDAASSPAPYIHPPRRPRRHRSHRACLFPEN